MDRFLKLVLILFVALFVFHASEQIAKCDDGLNWTLVGDDGETTDEGVLRTVGTGQGSVYWRTGPIDFKSASLYRFSALARRIDGEGCVITGPAFANRDYRLGEDWTEIGHTFRVPDDYEGTDNFIRVGQWEGSGTVEFKDVELVPVLPIHAEWLGRGETINSKGYTFSGTFSDEMTNCHRTLYRSTARFNSNRWCFHRNSEVIYRFTPRLSFTGKANIQISTCYAAAGRLILEWSDSAEGPWTEFASIDKIGSCGGTISIEEQSRRGFYIRIRPPEDEHASIQVDRIDVTCPIWPSQTESLQLFTHQGIRELPLYLIKGATYVGHIIECPEGLHIDNLRIIDSYLTDSLHLSATLSLDSDQPPMKFDPLPIDPSVANRYPDRMKPIELEPGKSQKISFFLPKKEYASRSELYRAVLSTEKRPRATLEFEVPIPDYYRNDYGRRAQGDFNVPHATWWCEPDWKVAPRISPQQEDEEASTVELFAARGDVESVQIVMGTLSNPTHLSMNVTAEIDDFVGPDGARISSDRVDLLRPYYHFVHHKTDSTGVVEYWPDALIPLAEKELIPFYYNKPIWLRVDVPRDIPAGEYKTVLKLRGRNMDLLPRHFRERVQRVHRGPYQSPDAKQTPPARYPALPHEFKADIPVTLHVWDFTLPETNHIETAFGLNASTINRYHNLKTEADKRKVWDMYLAELSKHRISIYTPTPLDPIRVTFRPDTDPPRADVDTSDFEREYARVVEKYHSTGFRLPVKGLGGGTFHERWEPKIDEYGADTPEYQAMMRDYLGKLEAMLARNGWLDHAYVYWFDEPDPKDYEFVKSGFETIRRYAPQIRNMLTEQPEAGLVGPVDIWCPVSHHFEEEAARQRMNEGERFWWYVCCGPKAPYCTLFIDHPATELRAWLWQTWQRDITGILVWSSNYWTSSAAYPDPEKPQNPYLDPMGYVSGYSTPKGVKRYWGNGDGRFLYPPLSAAVPKPDGPPVLEPPVGSIRLEMLREGIEDYEMLYMLRELLADADKKIAPADRARYEKLLTTTTDSVSTDMTTFTTDPRPILALRRQIAEAIEAIGADSPSE